MSRDPKSQNSSPESSFATDRRLLVDLEVLALVEPGDKLGTSTRELHVLRPSVFRELWRMITADSRSSAVSYLEDLVRDAIDRARHNPVFGETLARARRGITNLIETYKEDRRTVARLNVLLATIKDPI